jgi:ABC-2 type transport system ATP-binding protein
MTSPGLDEPREGRPPALKVDGLKRCFGTRNAVENLDLRVMEGDLYGFLGPNGAGKTTAMRCMLGLLHRDAGSVEVFGERDPIRQRRFLGAMVETPRFHEWLSARVNLGIACAYAGIDARSAEAEVQSALDRVGLSDRAEDPVKAYSLGMKQRLGIARTLLGGPRLLLLDEPTNGLDPRGMRDIRELLLGLCRRDGITVFLSSHLLAEVEALCNRVGILDRGRLVAEGEVSHLLREVAGADDLELGSADRHALVTRLSAMPEVSILGEGESGRLHVRVQGLSVAGLARRLIQEGIEIQALVPRVKSLEDLFLQRTRNEIR